jgi:hypothetical protein
LQVSTVNRADVPVWIPTPADRLTFRRVAAFAKEAKAETRIVSFINIEPDDPQFTVSSVNSEFLRFVLDRVPRDLEIGRS